MKKKIKKSVSAIIIHKDEILFLKRQNNLNAFPGYTSFPGGKVEKSERPYQAIKRELIEEIALDLDQVDHTLVEWTSITSPDFNPHQFENIYFKIVLKHKNELKIDLKEIKSFDWLTKTQFLEDYKKGNRLIIMPMLDILNNLNLDTYTFKRKVLPIPIIEPVYGLKQLMPLSNTLPPANRTNAFLIGDNSKVLVDPSPKDTEEYQKLINALSEFKIEKIFLTHHHGDHHQFANILAQDLSVPIAISKDSFQRISSKKVDYFKNTKVILLKDGDILTQSLGDNVRLYAVPGHDEGQLAIAPDSMKWFIAGDLFQGMGSVVIGGEEGDMIKYMQSLQKVIDLNPACVLPSHGIALGGTHIIQKNLKHRQIREQQIIELLNKKYTKEKILETIYIGLNEKLKPYAMANIDSHIDKITKENLLL